MKKAVDVSKLPMIMFGHHDPLWWAMLLLIAIEGTMLVLLAVAYVFVADRTHPFPPTHMGRDVAIIATAEVAVWIASIWPAIKSNQAAVAGNIPGMKKWLIIAIGLGLVAIGLRMWEFDRLPFRWDSHAYGSVVWCLMGLQWVHQLTGIGEECLFLILLYRGPFEDKHRVDVEVTTPLWLFVVAGSLLVWALVFAELLFVGPR